MIPTSPHANPTPDDRAARVRASFAERCGSIEDSLGETGHAPDLIDTTGIGHCRVVAADAWVPAHRSA